MLAVWVSSGNWKFLWRQLDRRLAAAVIRKPDIGMFRGVTSGAVIPP